MQADRRSRSSLFSLPNKLSWSSSSLEEDDDDDEDEDGLGVEGEVRNSLDFLTMPAAWTRSENSFFFTSMWLLRRIYSPSSVVVLSTKEFRS